MRSPNPSSPRTTPRFLLVALALAGSSLTAPNSLRADGLADEADLHFTIGIERIQARDYRGALEHFLLSNRLVPNRNVVFNIARMYELLQRFPDAHRYYVDALEGQTNESTLREINGALQRIGPQVAVLRIETTPPGATVYLNRRDLGSRGRTPRPLAVDQGTYRVLLELDGYTPAEVPNVSARTGAETRVQFQLERIVGSVRIEGDAAGATVHLESDSNAALCTAPCSVDLPPGPHTLYFTREGFEPVTRQITVRANESITLTDALRPLTGSVVVDADERGALVEIGGRTVGFTPAVATDISVGTHQLRVTLRGFQTVVRQLEVRANEQLRVTDLRMTPVREVTAASRVTESIDDAPSSVSIIDGQEIRAFGYPVIGEALRGVRGVYISNDRAYYSAGIRGLGEPNDYGNRLLVLSDGSSLNDNLLNSSYIGTDGRMDLHDVERIEVVRGPGSLLYGTGAFSGVVNLVLRGRESPTSAHASVGTFDGHITRARAGGHLNFTRNAGVWASVSGARSDGIDVPVTLTDPMGGEPNPIANRVDAMWGVSTAGRAWVGPVTAQWFYNQRQQIIPVGVFGATFNDPRTSWTDTRAMGEIRFEPRISDKLQVMLRGAANHYFFHADAIYPESTPGALNVEEYRGTWFTAEARIVANPLSWLRLTAGFEGQYHPEVVLLGDEVYSDNTSTYPFDPADPASGPYLDTRCEKVTQGALTECQPRDRSYYVLAGYLVADANPTSWFRMSLGGRLDYFSTFGPTFNPRGAIILRPWTGGVFKLMGGSAFRAPSIYERLYTDGGIAQIPGEDLNADPQVRLNPERIYSGEAEFSQRFLEDWVALGAFHASLVDGIINTVPVAQMDGIVQYRNSTVPARTLGFDLELRREWRQGWMLSASYSFQDARYTADPSGAMDPTANTRLTNAPEHLASFRGVIPVVPGLASLALRMAVEAPRRITSSSDTTTDWAIISDVALSGTARLDDAKISVRYALGLYNLFDWKYRYPTSEVNSSLTQLQNGRTLLLDVTVTY